MRPDVRRAAGSPSRETRTGIQKATDAKGNQRRRHRLRTAVLTAAGGVALGVVTNLVSSAVETKLVPTPVADQTHAAPAPTLNAPTPYGPPSAPLTLSSGVGMPIVLNGAGQTYAPVEYLLRNTSDKDVTVSGVEHEGRVCLPGLAQHAVIPAGGTLPVVVSVSGSESRANATTLHVVVDSQLVPVSARDVPDRADEMNWAAAAAVFDELVGACDPNPPVALGGTATP